MREPTLLFLKRRVWIWTLIFSGSLMLFYLFKSILLPFIVGILVAYLLNPTVEKLETLNIPRVLSTTLMILLFFITIGGLLFFTIPFLKQELLFLAQHLPTYGERLYQTILPLLEQFNTIIPVKDFDQLKTTASAYFGDMLSWGFKAVASILTNTLALANLLSLVVLTPVIAFYLLRDWPRFTSILIGLLPLDHTKTIKDQVSLINQTLASYVRGQSLVCLCLALYYSVSLKITGLNFALSVGIATGLLAFIPYFGFLLGATVALGLALSQFNDWTSIGWVAGVFALGQGLESYLLTPKFVGERIGLHPVWIIFSLLAGGVLFGFLGIVLAMPIAATLSVIIRFTLKKYYESDFYKGISSSKLKLASDKK
jgi:predicted PurR-regulated permease PerM